MREPEVYWCEDCGGVVDRLACNQRTQRHPVRGNGGGVSYCGPVRKMSTREDGIRAALAAATKAELEPDSEDLFYAPGERGLRAIERLLEETKRDE